MILVKSKLVETIQEFSLGWHFNLNLQTRIKSFMLKFMFGSAINDHPVLLLCHTYDHTQHYCYVTRVTTHGATVMLNMWPPTVLLLCHVCDHPQRCHSSHLSVTHAWENIYFDSWVEMQMQLITNLDRVSHTRLLLQLGCLGQWLVSTLNNMPTTANHSNSTTLLVCCI